MVGSDIVGGGRHRRRRRVSENATGKQDDDYYDDSNDEKGHHRLLGDERIFKGSCSLGKFFLNPCLCMYNTLLSYWWKFRRKQLDLRTTIKTCIVISLVIIVVPPTLQSSILSLFSFSISSPSSIRPLNDRHVDRIAVRIPSLDQDDGEPDIGGWKHFLRFILPEGRIDLSANGDKKEVEGYKKPDFGSLKLHDNPPFEIRNLHLDQEERPARSILPNDEELAEKYWYRTHGDHGLKSYYEQAESLEDRKTKCRRPSWKYAYYPSCNSFHEVDLSRDYGMDQGLSLAGDDQFFDTFFISHGYYRDVWVLHNPPLDEKSILKISRWKHDYGPSTYYNTLMDAQVMERLTHSPRIVDIYGHCGSAVLVEAIPFEVEEVIIHGDGFLKPRNKNDENSPLESFSPYTPDEKLDIAIQMAESIADLHGFSDGIM
jgi:hypothetical protein